MNSMVLWSQVKSWTWINEVRLWQIISDNSNCLQDKVGCGDLTMGVWCQHYFVGRILNGDLVGVFEHGFYCSIYWEEYSQLTHFFQRGRSSTNQWLLLSPDRKPVQHGSSLFWVSQGGACWKHCITQRNIGKRSDTDDLCLKQSNAVQYYSKTVAFIVFR